jgi:hypothetical protein
VKTTKQGIAAEAAPQEELSTATLPARDTTTPLLEQITNLISQFDSVKECRVVEVAAKHQKEVLISQGHKPEPSISLSTRIERDGEEAFYETYGENGRVVQHRIGKTLPFDYDISDKKLSKRARDRIEQLASQQQT